MNDILDFKAMFYESRSRVYLVWAFITGVGFTATHYYQDKNINFVWFVLSAIGFYYMYKVMPLRVKQMRNIYLSWLIPICIGLGASIIAVRTDLVPELVGYLGAFWLVVSAVGYFWNGISDSPGLWYYIASAVNLIGAGAIYSSEGTLLIQQYLVVAVVSFWSMLMLWVFRSE